MTEKEMLLIEKYLDGSLSGSEAAGIRERIESCPEFAREFFDVLALTGMIRSASHPEIDCRSLAQVIERSVGGVREESSFSSRVIRRIERKPPAQRPSRSAGAVSRGRSRSAWLRYGLGAVAAAAAVLLAVHLHGARKVRVVEGSLVAEVVSVDGRVERVSGAGAVPLRAGATVRPGQKVLTGAGSRVELAYAGESTRLRLGPETSLLLERNTGRLDRSRRYRLERGELLANVAPQPAGSPMEVVTPHARAEVVGTSFRLVAGPEGTRLEVMKGRVRLSQPGSAGLVVGAGMHAAAGPGRELVAGRTGGAAPEKQPPEGNGQAGRKAKVLRELKADAARMSVPSGLRYVMFSDGAHVYLGSVGLTRRGISQLLKLDASTGRTVKANRLRACGLVWDGKSLWCLESRNGGNGELVLREVDLSTLGPKPGGSIALPESVAEPEELRLPQLVATGGGLGLVASGEQAFLLVPKEKSWDPLFRAESRALHSLARMDRSTAEATCTWGGRRWSTSRFGPHALELLRGVALAGADLAGEPRTEVIPLGLALPAGSRLLGIAPAGKGRFWLAVRDCKRQLHLILLDTGVKALAAGPGGAAKGQKGQKSEEPEHEEKKASKQERHKDQGTEKKKE
jgi:ferric-dicitrate binding protein FerR (iron transport regulator)